jgi:hypothetical protein
MAHEIEPSDLVEVCKAYNKLGWAVAEQLDDVLNGTGSECNPNALDMIADVFFSACERADIDIDCMRGLLEEALEGIVGRLEADDASL